MAENGGWFREYSDGTNKRRYLLAEPGFCFVMLYPFHSTCAFPEPGIEPGTCDFRVRRASHSAAIRRPKAGTRSTLFQTREIKFDDGSKTREDNRNDKMMGADGDFGTEGPDLG